MKKKKYHILMLSGLLKIKEMYHNILQQMRLVVMTIAFVLILIQIIFLMIVFMLIITIKIKKEKNFGSV